MVKVRIRANDLMSNTTVPKFTKCFIFSSPSFSFDAMLRYTNVNLELIQDEWIYEFLENGLRGGCSTIFHRLCTSNSEEIEDLHDPRVEGSTIKYLGGIFINI